LRADYPRPQTQIPVYDEYGQLVAVADMGWEDIKVAVEYDGDRHWTDRRQFNKDIARIEALTELGWVVVRVTAEDVPGGILRRVAAAWARRNLGTPSVYSARNSGPKIALNARSASSVHRRARGELHRHFL